MIDAKFEVVDDRITIRWSAVFWWALYTAGFAAVAADAKSWQETVFMVYCAAAFPIVWRWLSSLQWVAGPEVEGPATRLYRRRAKAGSRADRVQRLAEPPDPASPR